MPLIPSSSDITFTLQVLTVIVQFLDHELDSVSQMKSSHRDVDDILRNIRQYMHLMNAQQHQAITAKIETAYNLLLIANAGDDHLTYFRVTRNYRKALRAARDAVTLIEHAIIINGMLENLRGVDSEQRTPPADAHHLPMLRNAGIHGQVSPE
ncbi:hypothetical protein FA95DRAFT_1609656 [Auriscalpium vulgare]|uniref:Uncharacterized protein n=1 Tax=Auriscalpium vulgare TaxID=40419 RepID=A0ACB8RG92_9AGAM|nr:hypothetical protein FA95DRAFT_1609656 [Auriscalpium vulgare]